MLMLILPGENGKIALTLLISIISGSKQGGKGEALYCNLSLFIGFQMGSEGGAGYSPLNGQSLDSSFPLLNATQMVNDTMLILENLLLV